MSGRGIGEMVAVPGRIPPAPSFWQCKAASRTSFHLDGDVTDIHTALYVLTTRTLPRPPPSLQSCCCGGCCCQTCVFGTALYVHPPHCHAPPPSLQSCCCGGCCCQTCIWGGCCCQTCVSVRPLSSTLCSVALFFFGTRGPRFLLLILFFLFFCV